MISFDAFVGPAHVLLTIMNANEIKVGQKVQFTMVNLGGESDGTWVGTVERLFKNGKAQVRVSGWINLQGYKVFNVKVSSCTAV